MKNAQGPKNQAAERNCLRTSRCFSGSAVWQQVTHSKENELEKQLLTPQRHQHSECRTRETLGRPVAIVITQTKNP
jgi:hypothetical protein